MSNTAPFIISSDGRARNVLPGGLEIEGGVFRPPVHDTVSRDALGTGIPLWSSIFNTDTERIEFWDGIVWRSSVPSVLATRRSNIELDYISPGIFRIPDGEKFFHSAKVSVEVKWHRIDVYEGTVRGYMVGESGGAGTGYDTIFFGGIRPKQGEVYASYWIDEDF
jgi:hypothetical protein